MTAARLGQGLSNRTHGEGEHEGFTVAHDDYLHEEASFYTHLLSLYYFLYAYY